MTSVELPRPGCAGKGFRGSRCEIAQCDFWFPSIQLPVGYGQSRRTGADAGLTKVTGYSRTALGVLVPARPPPAVAVWTPTQTGALLDSIEGHRIYALYHLIAFRGLRRGEAVGLPWTNVDLDNGSLTVSTQIVQLGWATEVAAPKADSEGVIALDGGTVEVLRTHREQQQEEARNGPPPAPASLAQRMQPRAARHVVPGWMC